MEADGQGKIISSPRLVTADQTKALIEQGTEYPYSVTAPNGATTIAFKKAVLKLEVTPQITPEGDIILDLDVNKDSRGETTTQGVAIDTKHIKTQVLVQNGGTVVIGGIFEMEETNQESKIPFLGDVDRKSTRLNSSHSQISYAVFCLKKKKVGADSLSELKVEYAERSNLLIKNTLRQMMDAPEPAQS